MEEERKDLAVTGWKRAKKICWRAKKQHRGGAILMRVRRKKRENFEKRKAALLKGAAS